MHYFFNPYTVHVHFLWLFLQFILFMFHRFVKQPDVVIESEPVYELTRVVVVVTGTE